MRISSLVCLIFSFLMLTQCDDSTVAEDFTGASMQRLYNRALDTLLQGTDLKKAATQFEEVQINYPLSPWAVKAEIMAAYAYYEQGAYENSLTVLNNFINYHRRHAYSAYALYLTGMCYYVQLLGVNRDQEMTYKAISAFRKLIQTYPQSSYARDAQLKLDLANEHLAGHSMDIGRYYQIVEIETGALGRFQDVIENFQTTSHAPEALYRMTEVFAKLQMDEEARRATAVLGHNYPGSQWYEDAYNLLKQKNAIAADKDGPFTGG